MHFDSTDNEFSIAGWLEIYVLNQKHLNAIIQKIKNLKGVRKVERLLD